MCLSKTGEKRSEAREALAYLDSLQIGGMILKANFRRSETISCKLPRLPTTAPKHGGEGNHSRMNR